MLAVAAKLLIPGLAVPGAVSMAGNGEFGGAIRP